MTFDLVILDGTQASRRIPVGSTPVTIGRSEAAGYPFPLDNFISGVHASVQASPQGVLITDLRSTNGTFLNGSRISQAVAELGDVIQIGTMTLQVTGAQPRPSAAVLSSPPGKTSSRPNLGGTQFALPQMEVPLPPAAGTGTTTIPMINVGAPAAHMPSLAVVPRQPFEEVLTYLERIQTGVFAMINAAADETITLMLAAGGLDLVQHSLIDREATARPPAWTPYLLQVSLPSPLLRSLMEKGWGKGWVSFFTSKAPFDTVRQHFARFMVIQTQGGGEVYFRFYDPAVLRGFFPAANPSELAMFFGPADEWLLEGDNPKALLQVQNSPAGLQTSTVALHGAT